MARILVTGGAGYIGSVLAPKLARSYEVTVLDACIFGEPAWSDPRICIVRGDIRDPTAVARALEGVSIVIHLAALANDPASELDAAATRAINYDATEALLRASRAAGVRRFIYASSSSVYGVKAEQRVVESLPLEPITLYAQLKAEAEALMVAAASPDFTTVSVRSATVCGVSPRQRFDVIVNIMCRLAETTGRITVHGGEQQRPNIHIEDITDAYVALVEAPATAINSLAFNVGASNHSVLEIAQMVQRICGGELVVDHNVQDPRSYRIDSTLIREAIGFEVRRGIDDAIEDLHAAFRAGVFRDHEDERYYNVRATKRWLEAPASSPGGTPVDERALSHLEGAMVTQKVEYSYLTEQFAQAGHPEAESVRVRYIELAKGFRAERTLEAIRELLKTGDFTLGAPVAEFERRFAELCGVPYALGVNSGTDALFLAMKAHDIGPGDEVITQVNTFIATAGAIVQAGAKPVFADVLPDMTIDPDDVAQKITARTRAIIPVHWTGNIGDIYRLLTLAERRNLLVIEDAAQAAGARNGEQAAGSFGAAAGFSLHPLKNLNVWGDGGVVTTRSAEVAERIRLLRNHGLKNRDEVARWGYNSRLDSLQAVVALVLMDDLEEITRARIRNAAFYDEAFVDLAPQVQIPPRTPGVRHVYHLYQLFVDRRDELLAYLIERGIEAKVHYPVPLHLQPAAASLGYTRGDFPVGEEQAGRIITLPVHQHLQGDQLERVASTVRGFYGR